MTKATRAAETDRREHRRVGGVLKRKAENKGLKSRTVLRKKPSSVLPGSKMSAKFGAAVASFSLLQEEEVFD